MSAIGRVRQAITGSISDSVPTYKCCGCGSHFELQYHVCPLCGSFSVERSEWDC